MADFTAAKRRAEQRARAASRADEVNAAVERMGSEADPTRVEEAKRLAAARWDAAEAERVATEATERRQALLQFEEGLSNRRLSAERQLATFRSADGTTAERIRTAEDEEEVQERIREARKDQLGLSEAQIRSQVEQARAATRLLGIEQARAQAAEDHTRAMERERALLSARLIGPGAAQAEEIRQAGISASLANPDDPDAGPRAVEDARLKAHAGVVVDLQSRVRALKPAYEQALEEADLWREGALAGLDPMAEGYAEFAQDVERVTARMYVDALQHSTDYFDGVKRGLADLKAENEDWASTSEDFVRGWASRSEEAFVGFVKTGKFELASLADFMIEQMAQIAYQSARAPVPRSGRP